jgi:D-glycero-D-manno-heptose 1,7-bisphosphate phosphatase
VFLDRDGTLIEDAGYLDRLDRIAFFPYSVDAVRLLNRAGFAVIVASNQSGVARGFVEETFIDEAHRRIADVLAGGGARVDGFYYCPHHPEGRVTRYRQSCDCRKPKPGLLHRAAGEHRLDLARSFVVGDRPGDIEAGAAVGAAGVQVRTGYGRNTANARGHATVDNLMEAVSWILRQS